MLTPISQKVQRAARVKTALIVDDSRTQRLIFAKHLKSWGYDVFEANTGRDALDMCRKASFDLILSDWVMPEMDGPDFCKRFRSIEGENYSYFILLTSKNDKDAVAEGLDMGADDFLSKPVSPPELRARISAGERLLAMERELRRTRGQLVAAVEALDDGFVYFDADDRLVLANSKFREFYPHSAPAMVTGKSFEEILRLGVEEGAYIEAIGREEEWIRERLAMHHRGSGERQCQRLTDGRVLQSVERETVDGGRVGLRVDVTELHSARENARRAEAFALEQNRELRKALDELQNLYDALDRDLIEARRLQQSLIQRREHEFEGATLSFMLQSSGHVGGDMVGMFRINSGRIGIYAIDVAGHGVAAAMLGARIAGLFSRGDYTQNIVLTQNAATGEITACEPHEVATRINQLMLKEFDTETYVTIAYADFEIETGRLRLVQAGHPHPAIRRADGRVEFIGTGGLPVGLIRDADFLTIEANLAPGDKLFLYSDGISECANSDGDEFGEAGLRESFDKLSDTRGAAFLDALKWELANWAGNEEFEDDVSGALLERHPAAADARSRGSQPIEAD